MPKDESMDVRIAVLESKVDDLLGKVAELQQAMATRSDIASLQRQLDGLQRQLDGMQRQLDNLRSESERTRVEFEARIEQRFESAFKHFATKAEVRKELLTFALGIVTVQTAINAAMISAVVQFLR